MRNVQKLECKLLHFKHITRSSFCNIYIYKVFFFTFLFCNILVLFCICCVLYESCTRYVSNILTLCVISSSNDFFLMPSSMYLSCSKESTCHVAELEENRIYVFYFAVQLCSSSFEVAGVMFWSTCLQCARTPISQLNPSCFCDASEAMSPNCICFLVVRQVFKGL